MTNILTFVAAVLTAALFSALLRKNAPEAAVLLGVALFVAVLVALTGDIRVLADEMQSVLQRAGIKSEILIPLLKVLGISAITGAAGAVCADAGEKAAAFLLNLAGTVCAFAAVLPLMGEVVEML
ncbi:MAG: hypothetical protein IKU12_03585, partial [Oscillospiraceae bacterium]|nr:hypothetical protein [Oscillospiraceae bacterium]